MPKFTDNNKFINYITNNLISDKNVINSTIDFFTIDQEINAVTFKGCLFDTCNFTFNINNCNFHNCKFITCTFTNIQLVNTTFQDCAIQNSNFKDSVFDICIFKFLNAANTSFFKDNFLDINFNECALTSIDFSESRFTDTSFNNSTLDTIYFTNVDISNIDFNNTIKKNFHVQTKSKDEAIIDMLSEKINNLYNLDVQHMTVENEQEIKEVINLIKDNNIFFKRDNNTEIDNPDIDKNVFSNLIKQIDYFLTSIIKDKTIILPSSFTNIDDDKSWLEKAYDDLFVNNTQLMYYCSETSNDNTGYSNIEKIYKMLNSKDINIHYNNDQCLQEATKNYNIDLIKLLLNNGADISKINLNLKINADTFIESSFIETILFLIERGIKVTENDFSYALSLTNINNKPIVNAIYNKIKDTININDLQYLIAATPKNSNNLYSLQFLIERGATINNMSYVDYLITTQNLNMLNYFLYNNIIHLSLFPNNIFLSIAITSKSMEIINVLVLFGIKVTTSHLSIASKYYPESRDYLNSHFIIQKRKEIENEIYTQLKNFNNIKEDDLTQLETVILNFLSYLSVSDAVNYLYPNSIDLIKNQIDNWLKKYPDWYDLLSKYKNELFPNYTVEQMVEIISVKTNSLVDLKIASENIYTHLNLTLTQLRIFLSLRNNLLSQGGQGKVYDFINNDKYILKESICNVKDQNCTMLEQKIVYSSPQSIKTIIKTPDTVNENIVGVILNTISMVSPFFVYNFGVTWNDKVTYSISERLETNLFYDSDDNNNRVIKTGNDFFLFLTQFLHALAVAQQTNNFTHGDCHLLNILVETNDNPNTPGIKNWSRLFVNKCIGKTLRYETHKFYLLNETSDMKRMHIKINDFGMSRLERDDIVYESSQKAINNYGKFLHNIDYLTLFGCIFYKKFDVSRSIYAGGAFEKMINSIKNVVYKDDYIKELTLAKYGHTDTQSINRFFFSLVCKDFDDNKYVSHSDNFINNTYADQPFYRPDNNFISTFADKFKTPDQIIIDLFPILKNRGLLIRGDINDSIRDSHTDFFNEYKVFYNNIPYQKVLLTNKDKIFIKDVVGIYKTTSTLDKSSYNYTDSSDDSCITMQIATIATIDLNKMKENSMKFISSCCDEGMLTFFEKINRFGVAINGVFFDLLKTNFPIGEYMQKGLFNNEFVQKFNVPFEYRKYYALFGYNIKNNTFMMEQLDEHIEETIKNINTEDYTFLCVSGPILINKDKNYKFSEKDIETVDKNNVKIFQCKNNTNINKSMTYIPEGTTIHECVDGNIESRKSTEKYPRCENIQPGQLSHAGNLNPRSMLGYNKEKNKIYFIAIEGRGQEGDGMDVVQMVNEMLKIDKDVTYAINLDGGQSSSITAREEDNDNIIYTNKYRSKLYPSGNILAIVNE